MKSFSFPVRRAVCLFLGGSMLILTACGQPRTPAFSESMTEPAFLSSSRAASVPVLLDVFPFPLDPQTLLARLRQEGIAIQNGDTAIPTIEADDGTVSLPGSAALDGRQYQYDGSFFYQTAPLLFTYDRNGAARAIYVHSDGYQSSQGIRVGDTEAEIERICGTPTFVYNSYPCDGICYYDGALYWLFAFEETPENSSGTAQRHVAWWSVSLYPEDQNVN